MKIIALGDTHGRNNWKEIVEKERDADKIIFIGDYFDTHENTTAQEQMDNFKEIIEYKKSNLDKVVLLIGNHDFHYLPMGEEYSGYQPKYAAKFRELIEAALSDSLLKMCFVAEPYVFTHAGITKTWMRNNNNPVDSNLEQMVNATFAVKRDAFKFNPSDFSGYGENIAQSPIWVRPKSLILDGIDEFIQVVGHTTQEHLIKTDKFIFIDCLGTSGEYLTLK